MTDRLKIWDENKEIAMLALAHLLDECDGLEAEPIIIVSDPQDPSSKKIADAISQVVESRNDIEAIVVANQNDATLQILPVILARSVLKLFNPECASIITDEAPEDQLWAAIISDGGMTILQVPLAPLRAIGSA